MKKFLLIFFMLFGLMATRAMAEDVVVVELFTSQGCDMCPPAHILQKEYAEKENTIALTWHVEHWDFMGWRDTYAKPEFSRRQYVYNKNFGRKGVYTPQAVINGRTQSVASKRDKLYAEMDKAQAGEQTPVEVTFSNAGGAPQVTVSGQNTDEDTHIILVWVRMEHAVDVKSGTNIGKTFESMNIVRNFENIGTLTGSSQTFPISLSNSNRGDSDAVAVLVQEGEMGPIVGAAFMPVEDLVN